jgi:hypothetical protein
MAALEWKVMRVQVAATAAKTVGTLICVILLTGLVAVLPAFADPSSCHGNINLDSRGPIQLEDASDIDPDDAPSWICAFLTASRSSYRPRIAGSFHADALEFQNQSGIAQHPLRAPPA